MSAGGRMFALGCLASVAAVVVGVSRDDRVPSRVLTVEEQAFGPGTYVYPSADPDNVPIFRQPAEGPIMKIWDTDPRTIARAVALLQNLYRACPATKKAWPMIEIVSLQPTDAWATGPTGKKYGWSDTLVIQIELINDSNRLDVLPKQLTAVWPVHEPAVFRLGDGHRPGVAAESFPAKVLCGQPASADTPLIPIPGLKVSPWPS